MKKLLIACIACLFAAPSFAQFSSGGFSLDEEHTYWGLRLGMSFGGIGGDIESDGGRTGMTLGGVIGVRVTDSAPVFVESGLYYTERGGKNIKSKYLEANDQTKLPKGHLNYLEVPVLIKYGFTTEENIAVLEWGGKLVGNTARIAALLCRAFIASTCALTASAFSFAVSEACSPWSSMPLCGLSA